MFRTFETISRYAIDPIYRRCHRRRRPVKKGYLEHPREAFARHRAGDLRGKTYGIAEEQTFLQCLSRAMERAGFWQ